MRSGQRRPLDNQPLHLIAAEETARMQKMPAPGVLGM